LDKLCVTAAGVNELIIYDLGSCIYVLFLLTNYILESGILSNSRKSKPLRRILSIPNLNCQLIFLLVIKAYYFSSFFSFRLLQGRFICLLC